MDQQTENILVGIVVVAVIIILAALFIPGLSSEPPPAEPSLGTTLVFPSGWHLVSSYRFNDVVFICQNDTTGEYRECKPR